MDSRNYSFWIESDHGFPVQRFADQDAIDREDNLAINAAKRAILKQRAEEFTARSIFEFVMHIDEVDGSGA